jgi:hypothetical protein
MNAHDIAVDQRHPWYASEVFGLVIFCQRNFIFLSHNSFAFSGSTSISKIDYSTRISLIFDYWFSIHHRFIHIFDFCPLWFCWFCSCFTWFPSSLWRTLLALHSGQLHVIFCFLFSLCSHLIACTALFYPISFYLSDLFCVSHDVWMPIFFSFQRAIFWMSYWVCFDLFVQNMPCSFLFFVLLVHNY